MNLQGFLRPELLFQRECLFFWSEAFCKTVLCPFSHEFARCFKNRIVFFNESGCFFKSLRSDAAPCVGCPFFGGDGCHVGSCLEVKC